MPSKTSKLQCGRLEARITSDLHAIVKEAAEIQGTRMTDFVTDAMRQTAVQAIN